MDAGVTIMIELRDHSEPCEHKTDYPDGFTSMVPYYCGHWIKGEGEWCPGGREVPIDDEADTEDVYQKEAWLPDVPGEGRYIWMIRSDVSASLKATAK